MTQYFKNFPLFFQGLPVLWGRYHISRGNKSLLTRLFFCLIVIDIFANTLLGGDPWETISSAAHKDRKSSWFAGVLSRILDVIDNDHGEKVVQEDVGEDSGNDRELHGWPRTLIIGFWVGLTLYGIYRWLI